MNDIRLELERINKEQVSIEKQIIKMEEDSIYDSTLYERLDELEVRRNKLEDMLEYLES